jgi:hypothetical protein
LLYIQTFSKKIGIQKIIPFWKVEIKVFGFSIRHLATFVALTDADADDVTVGIFDEVDKLDGVGVKLDDAAEDDVEEDIVGCVLIKI